MLYGDGASMLCECLQERLYGGQPVGLVRVAKEGEFQAFGLHDLRDGSIFVGS